MKKVLKVAINGLIFTRYHAIIKSVKVTVVTYGTIWKRKEMIIMALYSYLRVSTKHQKIDRQLTNVIGAYPGMKDHQERIYKDRFTGTTTDRPNWNNYIKSLYLMQDPKNIKNMIELYSMK